MADVTQWLYMHMYKADLIVIKWDALHVVCVQLLQILTHYSIVINYVFYK